MRRSRMPSELLTSSQVSRALGVSVATLKRWAEAGLIPSERTPGGHRRFRPADVEAFGARDRARRDPAARRAQALLASRGALDLEPVLLRDREEAGDWWTVAEEVLQARAEIGERVRAGAVTPVQAWAAAERAASAAHRLAERQPRGILGRALLLAQAPGAPAPLEAALLELCAAAAGWTVRPAGPATAADLATELRRERCPALLVWAGPEGTVPASHGGEVVREARAQQVSVALGGGGEWPAAPAGAARLASPGEVRGWLSGLGDEARARPAAEAPGPAAWDPSLAIGHPLVDAQHETLFAHVGRFVRAVRAGRPVRDLEAILEFGADYADAHFRAEENLMRRVGFPEVEAHAQEHERFRAHLVALQEALRREPGGRGPLVEAADYASTWLAQHVAESDQRIGRHLRAVPPRA